MFQRSQPYSVRSYIDADYRANYKILTISSKVHLYLYIYLKEKNNYKVYIVVDARVRQDKITVDHMHSLRSARSRSERFNERIKTNWLETAKRGELFWSTVGSSFPRATVKWIYWCVGIVYHLWTNCIFFESTIYNIDTKIRRRNGMRKLKTKNELK